MNTVPPLDDPEYGATQRLVTLAHGVVVHGPAYQQRAQEALRGVPGARSALAGDLASLEQTRALADQANAAGPWGLRAGLLAETGPHDRGGRVSRQAARASRARDLLR